MASSYVVRITFAVLAISFFLLLGTVATKLEEKKKYRLLIVQGLLFTQFLLICFAKYVWANLSVDRSASSTVAEEICRKCFMSTLAFLLIMAQCPFISGNILSNVEPHWFVVSTFICFGVMMMMVTLIFVWQMLESFLALLQFRRKRHSFSVTYKVTCILTLTVVLTTIAFFNANQPPEVRYFRIPVLNLPKSFRGFRILQLSDVHIGPTIGKRRVESIVELSNKHKPDVVLFTGDLVDAPLQIKPAVQPLSKLTQKYGAFFVAGNHDIYTGYIDEWIKEFELLNITVLHNHYVPLIGRHSSHSQEKIYLSGVFDQDGSLLRSAHYGDKLSSALNGREPGIPTILMAHRPSAGKRAATQFKDISLVLCGHTHGGQILPFALWHYISEPYISGLHKIEEANSYIYVSSGVFYWGMPMRQFSRADISIFILE